jgi:hypothetical protein
MTLNQQPQQTSTSAHTRKIKSSVADWNEREMAQKSGESRR